MSISVILIDKSEIVGKMLSHCLYYFSANVRRIESWNEKKAKIKEIEPDIIFVEWEIKTEGKALAFSVAEEMKPTPVVILYRSSSGPEINSLPSDQFPQRLVKPFDPKILRDTFTKLVPQMKDSKVHPFLKFPKGKAYEKEMNLKEENIKISPSSQKAETNPLLQSHLNQTKSPVKQTEKTDLSPSPPLLNPSNQTKSPVKQTEKTDSSFPSINSMLQETSTSKPSNTMEKQKNITQQKEEIKTTPEQHIASLRKKPPTLDREETKEFNIDETTQNDLAPMAIKSSAPERASASKSENIELNEKDILRILNKYKDTLEFQQLMEKTLKEHALEAVTKILQNDNLKTVLEKPLTDFKESQSFRTIVELEIKKYLKEQLPLTIKTIVEEEIKKIIGD